MPWINGVFVPDSGGQYTPDYSGLPQRRGGVTSAISGGAPSVGDRIGYYDRKGMYLGPLYDATGNKLAMPKGATGIHGSSAAVPGAPENVGRQMTLPAVLAAQNPDAARFGRPDLQAAYNLGYSGTPPTGTSPFARSYALGYGGREGVGVTAPATMPTAGQAVTQFGARNLAGLFSGGVNLASLAYQRLFGPRAAPVARPTRPDYAYNF